MKQLSVFLVSLLVATFACAAPPTPESLERLFRAINAEQLTTQMQGLFRPAIADGMMRSQPIESVPPEKREWAREQMRKATEIILGVFEKEMSWQNTKDIVARTYSEIHTQEEVDAAIAFYENPNGKAFASKTGQSMQRLATLFNERFTLIQPEFNRKAEAALESWRREVQAVEKR